MCAYALSSSPLAPSPDEFEAIKMNAPRAFNRLSSAWDRIINSHASRYRGHVNDHDDFCQIGLLALFTAAVNFDPAETGSFATYATTLIKNAMSSARRINSKAAASTCNTDKEALALYDAEVVEYPDHLIAAEDTAMIRRWRLGLTQRDGNIVELLFDRGLSMRVVAGAVGVSAARISQIVSGLPQSAQMVA